MTPPGGAWNEAGQSEDPAVALLERLGYVYAQPETLEGERESLRDVVLVGRLESTLKRLNPWISDDNLQKAVRAVTRQPPSTGTDGAGGKKPPAKIVSPPRS